MKSQTDPLNYCGLMLLCTLEKAFTSILNCRLVHHLEGHNLICEEQAGFRKGYSCLDQAFVLNTIIKNRLQFGIPTFCAFVDLQKYFDWIDRKLLCYKLLCCEVNGKFYRVLHSIYKETNASVKLNSHITDSFKINSGVMQGETLSPTLASLYLNDFAVLLKNTQFGIKLDDLYVSILLSADDIVLLANNEFELQSMLNCLDNWCQLWQTNYNVDKTKIMHFRSGHTKRSNNVFTLGEHPLETVTEYKYLGLFFDEKLDFLHATSVLSCSAGRALSAVISKQRKGTFSYDVFNKLYKGMVEPILCYFVGIWGHDEFSEIEKISKRSIRYFLGLPRNASISVMYSIMHWLPNIGSQFIEKARLYNRLISLPAHRLPHKVLLWDFKHGGHGWLNNFSKVIALIKYDDFIFGNLINMKKFKDGCKMYFHDVINENCQKQYKPKLYQRLGLNSESVNFIKNINNKHRRSIVSKLFCGVLKLEIELGIYKRVPITE